jgi:hypothetical protein
MTTCSLHGLRVGALALVTLLLRAAPASAQAEDQATARALFNEARDLMKAGQYEKACPKLEAASKLYAGSGLLLNLGDCYEHVGRTASAWTEFGEAVSSAERAGRSGDRDEALRRQSALEPRLSRLAIRVPVDLPGLVVERDDLAIDRGAWGTAIPVDPGAHSVTATATGRRPWSGSVDVTQPGTTVTIDVPELEPVPTAPPTVPQAPVPPATEARRETATEAPPYWTGRRVAGVVTTGIGVVGVGLGGVMGLVAKSQYDTAKADSGTQRHDESVSAVSLGNAATAIVGIGAAVAVGGAVLWLTAPDARVQIGTMGTGALVRGSF